jgi:hypothetical protein
VFLDEDVEPQIELALQGFDVQSVAKLKMQGLKNGALLAWLAQNEFEVLVTKDRNIPHQNPLRKSGIAVVVICGHGRLAPRFLAAPQDLRDGISAVKRGEWVEVFALDQLPELVLANT